MSHPWVSILSRFTSELLAFQSILFFTLLAGYAAFYVLRKRRLGNIEETIPKSVVQGYLNELISDAERMRAQLFGLLQAQGHIPAGHGHADMNGILAQLQATPGAAGGELDPALLQKLQAMEIKMGQQATAVVGLTEEKKLLEEEIARLKASGATAGDPNGAVPSGDLGELKSKLESLEAKLAEYSVIEDDLANLKRLQQENAQLKAELAKRSEGGTSAGPAVAAAAAAATSAPKLDLGAAPAAGLDPSAAGAPATQAPAAPPLVAEEMVAAPNPVSDAAQAQAAAEQAFEGLVDQLEATLSPNDPAAPGSPNAPALSAAAIDPSAEPAVGPSATDAPALAAAPSAPDAATAAGAPALAAATPPAAASAAPSQADADLVAEFEKMLSG
jgi:hypothetical protein